MSLEEALRAMDERDFRAYTYELKTMERRQRKMALPPRACRARTHDAIQFERDDPGQPLGVGMPTGSPIRQDGETHRQSWARILRSDPCAFCGRDYSGTLDHIEPQSRSSAALGGVHSWLNYVGACASCNGSKADKPLLLWMRARRVGAFS